MTTNLTYNYTGLDKHETTCKMQWSDMKPLYMQSFNSLMLNRYFKQKVHLGSIACRGTSGQNAPKLPIWLFKSLYCRIYFFMGNKFSV